eukprot:TRINITY_DN108692_c0_g1_i1.p1 TRINITY_DN108692_c0_g1~~TRINITY_DN108692_c0_g1_i1.p1  ORF type:complete len:320 (+),score=15.96 TRINITY_DN108692_c0_g1_i1:19-978(+)
MVTVAITGASKGIGAELAYKCASEGYNLVLVARRKDQLDAVVSKCNDISKTANHTSTAVAMAGDVCKRATFDELVSLATSTFGGLDVLVNNAGRGISKPTLELTEEDFDDMMAVNVKSVLWGSQAAVKHFKSKPAPVGQVINVSSMLGRVPSAPQRSAYAAAKHAVNSLTATMRMELADAGYAGVLVCGFHPGVVGTEFGLNALHGGFDNRLLPDAQPVGEVAAAIAAQIGRGCELMAKERARVAGKEEQREDGSYAGSTVFEDGEGVYDVYSRPQYKQAVEAYFGAEDMAKRERTTRAAYKDAMLKGAAQRARDAAEQ